MNKKETLIEFITKADQDTLINIYVSLKTGQWPPVLPDHMKPDWWEGNGYIWGDKLQWRKFGFSQPFFEYIKKK